MKSKGKFRGKTAAFHHLIFPFSLRLERFLDDNVPINSEKPTDGKLKTKLPCINKGRWKDSYIKSAGMSFRSKSRPSLGIWEGLEGLFECLNGFGLESLDYKSRIT
jgi:hypothetical protein